MVSGPNLNETSIVSGGYGGPAGGIIPTSTIKGTVRKPDCHPLQVLLCCLFLRTQAVQTAMRCARDLSMLLQSFSERGRYLIPL